MDRVKLIILIALIAVLAACGGQSTGDLGVESPAITNGKPDDADPAVVAVYSGRFLICTGTLVAPDLVLTAAHCLKAPITGVGFGSHGESPEARLPVSRAVAHPHFNALSLDYDLALLHLEHEARGVAPIPVLLQHDDGIAAGRTVRVVGFGSTRDAADPVHVKHQGSAVIDSVEPTTVRLRGQPSQPCVGDSGGPVFLTVNGVEHVIGVNSSGDAACAQFAREIRTDVSDFLKQAHLGNAAGGCNSVAQPAGWMAALLAALIARRRRNR